MIISCDRKISSVKTPLILQQLSWLVVLMSTRQVTLKMRILLRCIWTVNTWELTIRFAFQPHVAIQGLPMLVNTPALCALVTGQTTVWNWHRKQRWLSCYDSELLLLEVMSSIYVFDCVCQSQLLHNLLFYFFNSKMLCIHSSHISSKMVIYGNTSNNHLGKILVLHEKAIRKQYFNLNLNL